ncbi:MAG: hypothetical protein PHX83_09125 [Acidobacteriia bacterium]|nr:hypothetical protein [Terriglobia bacterium]
MKGSKFLRLLPLAGLSMAVSVAMSSPLNAQMPQKATSQQSQTGTAATQNAQSTQSSTATASANGQQVNVSNNTKVDAVLESTIDARTAKPGDQVAARVTKNVKQDGKVVIHKGDRLIGHVSSAQAAADANGSSSLGVEFNQLAQGQSVSNLTTTVSTIVSTPREQTQPQSEPMMMPAEPMATGSMGASGSSTTTARGSGGGLLGGVGSTANSATGTLGPAINNTTGAVSGTAQGVTGTAGSVTGSTSATLGNLTGATVETPRRMIQLSSNTQASGQAGSSSVFSTKKGNLHLDSGTQMQFRVQNQTSASTSKK